MYVAVKGGEKAIAAAHQLLAHERRGNPEVNELACEQIEQQLGLAVDRVMSEGGIYDRELAALAIKQSGGDVGEAPFTPLADETLLENCSHVFDLLTRQQLAVQEEDDGSEPEDITRTPPVYPASRAARMQQLVRGDEGFLLSLSYSTQRGYGRTHPFAGEIRTGWVTVEIVPEELGFAIDIGEILLTECEMVNGFVTPDDKPPHFTRGYGLVFGRAERKAMSMSLVDRALQTKEYNEQVSSPAQDEEFVLSHADNVEAAGFVSHLKLPHYVDFQAELELLKRLRQQHDASSSQDPAHEKQ